MNINFSGVLGKKNVTSAIYLTIPMGKETLRRAIDEGKVEVIKDDTMIEKVNRAKSILGRDTITPGDVRRLEKEGKL